MAAALKLISHKLCPYVQRAVIALTEKGVPFERIDIDLANKPDWFLKISPLGKADEAWIARALELPFFAAPPPKSLDRNDFAALKLGDVQPADGAATLTAFTAAAIARVIPLLPRRPRSWIICGGGARNLTMLRMLRERVGSATVEAAETLGWASDAIEAQAFGFLAARGLKGLPLSYPATTGVPMPMTGGVIARP